MKLTEKQIEEIADNLDRGMKCFYNLKTGEIKVILNFDNWIGADPEPWEEESKEIDENWGDYFEFVGFEFHESFQIMAYFTENITDAGLQNKLINALNGRKSFQNFKWQNDNSGEFRKQWFDYKKMRYIQWIKEQIDLNVNDIYKCTTYNTQKCTTLKNKKSFFNFIFYTVTCSFNFNYKGMMHDSAL